MSVFGFIVLNALAPVEPRARHTALICVNRLAAVTWTEPVIGGGEVAAVFTSADFASESVSTTGLASVEDAKVAVSYFTVPVENQAGANTRVAVVNCTGARFMRSGGLYPLLVEASGVGNPSRGLLEPGVYVDRAVSLVCPEALSPRLACFVVQGRPPATPIRLWVIWSPLIYYIPAFPSLTTLSYLQEAATLHDRRSQGLESFPHSCILATAAGTIA